MSELDKGSEPVCMRNSDGRLDDMLAEFRYEMDGTFNRADNRLKELGKRIGKNLNPERWMGRQAVPMLQDMTEATLLRAGYSGDAEIADNVVEFRVSLPSRLKKGYDLRFYSVPDGVAGFNTSSIERGEDNSRRWVVYIDRGTSFGAAFDYKGTVYETGRYEPSDRRQNIETGTIVDVVSYFYAHQNEADMSLEVLPDIGKQVSQATAA